jgi:hypothetical protein
MVNEIIAAFLGPLPLPQHPKSKPVTPYAVMTPVYGRSEPDVDQFTPTRIGPGLDPPPSCCLNGAVYRAI